MHMAAGIQGRYGLLAARALVAWLAVATLAAPTVCQSAPADEYAWDRMDAALFHLRKDDSEVKRDIAEDAFQIFAPLFDLPPGHDRRDAQYVVDDLRHWIGTERDEWCSTRLLRSLGRREGAVLDPLYGDALRSFSPNLRWEGVRWFRDHRNTGALPDLERVWAGEDRPWVQVDLLAVLASHGSDRYFEEFLHLTQSDDPDLATAALRALGTLGDARAVPALLEATSRDYREIRIAAIHALESWIAEPQVLSALLNLSRSSDPPIQIAAVRALASSRSPEVAGRLAEIVLSKGDTQVRAEAAEGLADFDGDIVLLTLLEVLHQPFDEDDTSLYLRVMDGLMNIDDPSVLDAIVDLDFSGTSYLASRLEELRESLGRDRAALMRGLRITTGCSLTAIPTDPSDPRSRVITPTPGIETARCWEAPGVAGDPEEFPRVRSGTPVLIEDHFEREGESWVAIHGAESQGCWVPLRLVQPPATPPASSNEGEEETMLIRREFDLPAVEVESDVARGLMDAGLLEVIEPADEVIGVAITLDPDDFDSVLLLARSCGLNETMLDGEIYGIVSDVAPLYRGRPVLDRFRRTPQPTPGETDDLIDLDIEELSDR
jgi:HEAT repeat protein